MSDINNQGFQKFFGMMVGAIGIVYGDVGTSPLYTMKEIFTGSHGIVPTQEHVFGVLSLIFWALIFVISIKYVIFVMSASNRGEGGIMALMALALRRRFNANQRAYIVALGLFGTALFYGDGVITPAISVLSAVEGLEIATPALHPYILPIAVFVLMGLFLFQKHGTEKVGLLFGPIMCVWFATLAMFGWSSVSQNPIVLEALNPVHCLIFFREYGWHAFIALGGVVLAVTGAEALYADMGHFGKRPIQYAWFVMVLPALALNYFGQGALILRNLAAAENPFYLLVPNGFLYPMIALSTMATVIASQAVISGAFSITSQAMQMDYIPRMQQLHTSEAAMGQIYVPVMNRMLLVLVIFTVLSFKSSGNLAAAYGIAVTGTMIITTLLVLVVAIDSWKWPPKWAGALAILFLSVDGAFFGANVLKIPQGGWFPLVLGAALYLAMSTWRRGREVLTHYLKKSAMSLSAFIADLQENPPLARIPGTAIFMTTRHLSMPHGLQVNYQHNQILHDRIILLTMETDDIPFVLDEEKIQIDILEQGFYRITAKHGFMESPDVQQILKLCKDHGMEIDAQKSSFFVSRETLIPSSRPDLSPWRERLFLFLFRNATSPIQFFNIPPSRVVELGAQFEV